MQTQYASRLSISLLLVLSKREDSYQKPYCPSFVFNKTLPPSCRGLGKPQQLSPSFSSQTNADTTIYHHSNGVGRTDHKPFHIASTIISNQLLVEKHQEICREKAQYYYGTHAQCIISTGHYATKHSTLGEWTHCSANH